MKLLLKRKPRPGLVPLDGREGARPYDFDAGRSLRRGAVGPRWLVVEGSALRRWPALRSPAPCRLAVTQRSLAICAEVPSGAR